VEDEVEESDLEENDEEIAEEDDELEEEEKWFTLLIILDYKLVSLHNY
jgi:hypothetical protein